MDGRALAAVLDLVEGLLGELVVAAGLLDVLDDPVHLARELAGDLDGGRDLGDGAGLLDGGRLPDPVGGGDAGPLAGALEGGGHDAISFGKLRAAKSPWNSSAAAS